MITCDNAFFDDLWRSKERCEFKQEVSGAISEFSLVWSGTLAMASYRPTDENLLLSALVFWCDVAQKPIRGMTTIHPNRLAHYHLRLLHHDIQVTMRREAIYLSFCL
ncbi:jg25127 [Pararge aegeria aegeria]|uniref:Jg25127 protein n=1 Tax=Pararge aegeria aegeria TaxID=348720 RepID=A0A8S4SFQ1_9NEOP|nr:jg25127 [Pararge aegeria aegeria]